MTTAAQKLCQPVAIFLICAITRFRQAVSIEKQTITFRECEMSALVTLLTKHSDRQSGRRYWRCDFIMHEQGRTMPRVTNFNVPIRGSLAANEGCIIRPHRIVGKKMICFFDQAADA